jgi:hypothetical protein
MVLESLACLLGWSLAATPAAAAKVPVPYTLVLIDGSYVKVAEPPTLEGDRALLRLYPSGLRTVLPAARIDAAATLLANAPPPPAAEPPAPIKPTVSGGRPAGAPPAPKPPAPNTPEPVQDPGEAERWSRHLATLLAEQRALEEERAALVVRRDELERDVRTYLAAPQVARGLARDLGRAERRLEEVSKRLTDLRDEIAMVYARAADRSIELRP